ncbi:MAG TPA: RsmB/NOP family class I SAM-dependent RNA methyltransferase [Chthonomonas sp.]|uniref:RsmB/NOP family class I SAM-dependent RNA methyltransferase n=1 Tax=Chthonomonas sp. TaxID=2282153 RepID=UPI002B4AD0EA|nr:RsmB/NOP family class I SAM-dependent RNA methyltransferase [Chthonomonas sp.]HLI49025.1 RsmB/NOP family class I SAM-dependent RNA methyltransferase [Chthonomonas sp.]
MTPFREEQRERGATDRAWQALREIYSAWESSKAHTPADRLANSEFRARRYLNAHERRWCAGHYFDAIRFRRKYQWLLSRLALAENPDTLLQLHLSLAPVSTRPPHFQAIVEEERLQAAVAAMPTPDVPEDYIRYVLSFPDSLARSLLQLFPPEEAICAAQAFNRRAPTILRVNPLLVSRAEFLKVHSDLRPTPWSPWGVYAPVGANVYTLAGYREGWFEIQEEASQLSAFLARVRPGDTVVEIGAGGGGKTLVLGALMRNRGRILAIDVHEGRLKELVKRVRHAQIRCVEPLLVEADKTGKWQHRGRSWRRIEQIRSQTQCVLLDAPCSGSGVLRRSPDARWREVCIEEFSQIQRNLLLEAASLVASGGRIVYVTCAFEPQQNEEVVEWFLSTPAGRGFRKEPVLEALREAWKNAADLAEKESADKRRNASRHAEDMPPLEALCAGDYVRTWPHRHDLDAFFVALLRRCE